MYATRHSRDDWTYCKSYTTCDIALIEDLSSNERKQIDVSHGHSFTSLYLGIGESTIMKTHTRVTGFYSIFKDSKKGMDTL